MLFKITFEDHGQDFLEWTIDTEKEEVVNCWPFQASIWVGKRTSQKAFEVGGKVALQFGAIKIKYPIESIDIIT